MCMYRNNHASVGLSNDTFGLHNYIASTVYGNNHFYVADNGLIWLIPV